MSETEEEKKKRWARNAANSYMTPAMAHAMRMSKYQSQTKYKETFNKSKGKGYTAVVSTPEMENVKKQSIRISQNKYKSEFEKNKAKFTQVADNPEQIRLRKVTNQVSKVAYSGKGTAIAERRYPRRREYNNTTPKKEEKKEPVKVEAEKIEVMTEEHKDKSYDASPEVPEENTYGEDNAKKDSDPPVAENTSYGEEATYEEPMHSRYEEPAGYTRDSEPNTESNYYGGQDMETGQEATTEKVTDQDFVQNNDYPSGTTEDMNYEPAGEYPEVGDTEEVQEVSESGLDDFYASLG